MTRYLVGLMVVAGLALGIWMLVPTAPPGPVVAPEPEPAAEPVADSPAEPEPAPVPEPPAALQGDALIAEMAAARRETLPQAAGTGITFSDAVFLPRMRIMEHVFVLDGGTIPTAADLRRRVMADTRRLCTEERALFEAGVTLRHSFRAGDGALLQRVHLLPEDCAG